MDDLETGQFYEILHRLKAHGTRITIRGQEVLELEDFSYTFEPYVRFMNFKARCLNLDYIKAELRWYLRGDPTDRSIGDHAKLWIGLFDEQGRVNSNYGYYLFRQHQVLGVIDQLRLDRHSRRASAVILQRNHLRPDNLDVPCTYGMNFRIRDDRLRLSVHMRSQDAIWGLGNDLPFFSLVQEIVATLLNVQVGRLHLAVDSFHIYRRHWRMLDKIVEEHSPSGLVLCPRIDGAFEAQRLLVNQPSMGLPFTDWLYGGLMQIPIWDRQQDASS